jgi:hypothetical protein
VERFVSSCHGGSDITWQGAIIGRQSLNLAMFLARYCGKLLPISAHDAKLLPISAQDILEHRMNFENRTT